MKRAEQSQTADDSKDGAHRSKSEEGARVCGNSRKAAEAGPERAGEVGDEHEETERLGRPCRPR